MPGTAPKTIWLYRIVHRENMRYLLRHGMCCREHPLADPDYINIGDSSLITNRHEYPIGIIPPGGSLGDYVPFYFGPHSPMLLRIRDGRGVTKRPQADIVYICCKLETVVTRCPEWCFTDGQAKARITSFYNRQEDLNKVDWEMVKAHWWANTDEDEDRMRRKQAEFLVRHHVPVSAIGGIIVYSEHVAEEIGQAIREIGLDTQVAIKTDFYY